ncbi:MAG: hypothetical protein RIE08_11075 [Acidimicrobiales bacterium]
MSTGQAPTLVRSSSDLIVLTRLLLRLHVNRARVISLGLLSSLTIALAAATRGSDDPSEAGALLVAEMGFGVILPVAVAWIGCAVVGDLVEDRTLVYLWQKPVSRITLATAAVFTSILVTLPVVGAPLVVAAVVADAEGLVTPVIAAVVIGSVAYSGLFVLAGARLRRGLWFALGYILSWENGIARIGDSLARLSISGYLQSIVAEAMDVSTTLSGASTTASVVTPLAVGLIGAVGTAVVLARREID